MSIEQTPLTGRNTTVIKGMLDYVGKFLTSDWELVNALVEKTKATRPFCPEKVKTKTPMFPKDFIPEGHIFFGDAVVIPNLLGHAEQSVLAILSKEHYLRLRDFTPEMFLTVSKAEQNTLSDYAKRLPQHVFQFSSSTIYRLHALPFFTLTCKS